MTELLDANVLVSLGSPGHVHHDVAAIWFAARDRAFATTPITEGALIRQLVRVGGTVGEAMAVLERLRGHARYTFWPDDLPYDRDMLRWVTGHAGVTDAHLVALARAHDGRLVTFDRALAATYPDTVDLIPTGR